MHRGYVKLWRKAEDSGLMRDHKTWAVWSWILIHAAHKPRSVVVGRIAVALLPGQLVFGRKALSEALNLTEQNVRSCLKLLEKLKNITIKPTNKFSILTVVNWELYQSEDQQPTNKSTCCPTSAQPATNQQPTTNKNEKNEKHEEKNLKGSSATGGPAAARDKDFILTKSGKKLTGKRMTTFMALWDAFADKRGKAEAADAWARIPLLTDALVAQIVEAARAYAVHVRPELLASGRTPKMLQGWLTARRWEDDVSEYTRSASSLSSIASWTPKEAAQ